jgi:hypothetical protein
MNDSPASPVYVALLFILRCLVPLAILFGISYLLRRLGLVAETPKQPLAVKDEAIEKEAAAAARRLSLRKKTTRKRKLRKKAPSKSKARRSSRK